MRSLVLAAALVAACGAASDDDDKAGNGRWTKEPRELQDEIASLVWDVFYEMDGTPLPKIWWHLDPDDRCWRGFWFLGRCVAGFSAGEVIGVAWWEGARYSQTALAHELGHSMLVLSGRDGCSDHECPPFNDGTVERINAALVRVGH